MTAQNRLICPRNILPDREKQQQIRIDTRVAEGTLPRSIDDLLTTLVHEVTHALQYLSDSRQLYSDAAETRKSAKSEYARLSALPPEERTTAPLPDGLTS